MLTGQAKTDYQREYMRKRRSNLKGLTKQAESVRPLTDIVRPKQTTQSFNPMMAGYVPPR